MPTGIIIDIDLTQDEDGGLFDAIVADIGPVIADNNHDAIVSSWDARIVDTTDLERAVLLAKRCVWLDSNDTEITRLQEAVSAACSLLGIDDDAIAEEAEKWADAKGLL